MQASPNDFLSPAAKSLYELGITPNQMIFWVMIAASKAIFDNPFCLTALRGELFPEIEKATGITPKAIDSLLRRTCKQMMEQESFAPLRAYLPNNSKQPPTTGIFLSMWVRMVADRAAAEKDKETSGNG